MVIGHLELFSIDSLVRNDNLEKLVRWRNSNRSSFLSDSPTNKVNTTEWYKSLLESSSRISFWVKNTENTSLGHVGIAQNIHTQMIELDNVLRGEISHPKIMELSVYKMEELAFKRLSTETLYLRVLKSNLRAISFYQRLNYELVPITEGSLVKKELSASTRDDPQNFHIMSKNLLGLFSQVEQHH